MRRFVITIAAATVFVAGTPIMGASVGAAPIIARLARDGREAIICRRQRNDSLHVGAVAYTRLRVCAVGDGSEEDKY